MWSTLTVTSKITYNRAILAKRAAAAATLTGKMTPTRLPSAGCDDGHISRRPVACVPAHP
ncbi:MAG: hypothetical protein OJF49_003971 [Ktedonobacterales bacterium]|nr:MAG: hypothetical protein OJF49_003971 [Ktedonobacterales bacterium]